MVRRALSLVFWIFLVVSSIVLFPVALLIWALTAPFDRRRTLLHRFTCFWASLYTWLNPAWRVRVEGYGPGCRYSSSRRTVIFFSLMPLLISILPERVRARLG